MNNANTLLLLDRKTERVVTEFLPDQNKINHLSSLFAIFSDTTRLKILSCLSISEMCVTDISRLLYINQTTVSHQLKTLKDVGIVKCKRQGKIIFYRVSDQIVSRLMMQGVEFLGY